MNRHETLKEYLTALDRAEAVVTDNPSAPLYFNGSRSLTDYRIHLLDVELPIITCLRSIRQEEEKDDALAISVRVTLLELQTLFGEENGQSTHRYLTITREGIPIERKLLGASQLELLEEYLRLQQASFLRQKKWFDSRPIPLPFPGTLRGNATDIAELIALHIHTSLAIVPANKYRIKEFILYFCQAWNLPAEKDYHTLISHTLARPHPTAYIEKLLNELQKHVEQLDSKRK